MNNSNANTGITPRLFSPWFSISLFRVFILLLIRPCLGFYGASFNPAVKDITQVVYKTKSQWINVTSMLKGNLFSTSPNRIPNSNLKAKPKPNINSDPNSIPNLSLNPSKIVNPRERFTSITPHLLSLNSNLDHRHVSAVTRNNLVNLSLHRKPTTEKVDTVPKMGEIIAPANNNNNRNNDNKNSNNIDKHKHTNTIHNKSLDNKNNNNNSHNNSNSNNNNSNSKSGSNKNNKDHVHQYKFSNQTSDSRRVDGGGDKTGDIIIINRANRSDKNGGRRIIGGVPFVPTMLITEEVMSENSGNTAVVLKGSPKESSHQKGEIPDERLRKVPKEGPQESSDESSGERPYDKPHERPSDSSDERSDERSDEWPRQYLLRGGSECSADDIYRAKMQDEEKEIVGNSDLRTTLYIGGLFESTDLHSHGRSELHAARLAIKHINEKNIIPGYKLDLVFNESSILFEDPTRETQCQEL